MSEQQQDVPGIHIPPFRTGSSELIQDFDIKEWYRMKRNYRVAGLPEPRLLLDGVDITNNAYYASPHGGYVDCYRRDENGRPVKADNGTASRHRLYGKVEIRYPEASGTH